MASAPTRLRFFAATALAASLLLAGCTKEEQLPTITNPNPQPSGQEQTPDPVLPVAVNIAIDQLPQGTKIGVLAPPLEGAGSEFRIHAEGAAIAAYRLAQGGTPIELVTALDPGTAEGGQAAIAELVDAGVAGIVMASGASHLDEAALTAARAGVPLIYPYNSLPSSATGQMWSLVPNPAQVPELIDSALAVAQASNPFVIADAASGPDLSGLDLSSLGLSADASLANPAGTASQVVTAFENRLIDSVVIGGSATSQAEHVATIQLLLADKQIPIILTPSSQTVTFASRLESAGITGAYLLSFGTPASDYQALAATSHGEAAASFLTAVRLGAVDPDCLNIYADNTCGSTSTDADTASHDAVLALAHLIAGTEESVLGSEHGIAGPTLDLGQPYASSPSELGVLSATAQDPGLRPTAARGQLFWFAYTP